MRHVLSCIQMVLTDTIPVTFVNTSRNSKPWITPFIISQINLRWNAFRTGNFSLYNDLKKKVKQLIIKSKQRWAKK